MTRKYKSGQFVTIKGTLCRVTKVDFNNLRGNIRCACNACFDANCHIVPCSLNPKIVTGRFFNAECISKLGTKYYPKVIYQNLKHRQVKFCANKTLSK